MLPYSVSTWSVIPAVCAKLWNQCSISSVSSSPSRETVKAVFHTSHGLIDIDLKVDGDLHIDGHHTVEDSALALGQAVAQALGDKRGIRRYGDALSPMDEVLTRVALDISGRPWLVWKVPFGQATLGTMDTELFEHFFHSFAQTAGITLHVELLHGHNNHHIAESAFKGLARALRTATEIDGRKADAIPSTKGVL